MKTIFPKFLFTLTLLLVLPAAQLSAESLEQQKAKAQEIALANDEVTEVEDARSIADSLGDAFGEEENVDALLQRVKTLSTANPDKAAAIAAAATAFVPTPEFAARVAAAAASVVPSAAANIARAVSAAVPSAATAIANAVINALPTPPDQQTSQTIKDAANQGAQSGTGGGVGGPGIGGGGGQGGVNLPSGGGGGGSGSGGGGGIYQ